MKNKDNEKTRGPTNGDGRGRHTMRLRTRGRVESSTHMTRVRRSRGPGGDHAGFDRAVDRLGPFVDGVAVEATRLRTRGRVELSTRMTSNSAGRCGPVRRPREPSRRPTRAVRRRGGGGVRRSRSRPGIRTQHVAAPDSRPCHHTRSRVSATFGGNTGWTRNKDIGVRGAVIAAEDKRPWRTLRRRTGDRLPPRWSSPSRCSAAAVANHGAATP